MGRECGWRHARKRWSWEFENLKKESVESWDWTMGADSWVSAIGARSRVVGDSAIESKSWVFFRCVSWLSFSGLDQQRWIEILNITRCAERWGCCLSPRVEEVNKPFVSEATESACFRLFLFLYMCCWHWLGLWLYNTFLYSIFICLLTVKWSQQIIINS